MLQKFSWVTLGFVSLIGMSAMASQVDCKVSGVDTRILVTGHQPSGPQMTEYKTANEVSTVTVFTNVSASHSEQDGLMKLIVTGDGTEGTAKLEVQSVSAKDHHSLKGSFTERSGSGVTLPVQCTAKD